MAWGDALNPNPCRREAGRINYVTPTSYLELITTFTTLLGTKRGEVRLLSGVTEGVLCRHQEGRSAPFWRTEGVLHQRPRVPLALAPRKLPCCAPRRC